MVRQKSSCKQPCLPGLHHPGPHLPVEGDYLFLTWFYSFDFDVVYSGNLGSVIAAVVWGVREIINNKFRTKQRSKELTTWDHLPYHNALLTNTESQASPFASIFALRRIIFEQKRIE